jgi:hypothetical protein
MEPVESDLGALQQRKQKRCATTCHQLASTTGADYSVDMDGYFVDEDDDDLHVSSQRKSQKLSSADLCSHIAAASPNVEEVVGSLPADQADDQVESARISEIERLLEMMNSGSDDLNASQKALAAVQEAQNKAVQVWATSRARLMKSIGESLISRAAPHRHQQRQLKLARRRVSIASAAFIMASNMPCAQAKCDKLAARHSRYLGEFQLAQQRASKVGMGGSAPPSWLMKSTAAYFDAEDQHLKFMEQMSVAEAQCMRRIDQAKSRYQDALRGLEALSEAEHHARKAATP